MSRRHRPSRRGVTAIVMVVLLIMISLIVTGVVLAATGNADLSLRRVETLQSFYAAESGVNMAIREIMAGADEDGDGAIGSISDDGNDANDPAVGPARVRVSLSLSGTQTTLTSHGRSGAAQRVIEAVVE